MGDLEDKCGEDSDIRISHVDLPVVKEEKDPSAPSAIMGPTYEEVENTANEALMDAAWYRARYENMAIQLLVAEAQCEIRGANHDKLYKELQGTIQELRKLKTENDAYKDAILKQDLPVMELNGLLEEAKTLIRMYEERFGPVEKLLELAELQDKQAIMYPKGDLIEKLIYIHKTGKRPKTVGQRLADCAERITDSICHGIYKILYGPSKKSNTAPIRIDDCG